ncbi:recombinase family protein [Vulgatibacter incomptus]|nr:recombinase family protein [Vulgatibacter incomptus]
MRTSAAMRENATQGYFNGSQPPYGYRKEKKEANAGVSRSVLVPDPGEAEILQQVFRLYIGGTGTVGVARDLNQRGLRYRSGTRWNKNHVLKVIEESAPTGTFYWGKRDTKTGALNDREDWIPIQVEAVIDPDLFDMAQRVRASRDPTTNPGRTGSSPLLLAGLLKCGKCGASYQLETSGKPTKGLPYRYYNCRSKVRTGKEACPGFRVRTEVLDKAILDHVAEKLFTPERCRLLLQDLVEETGILRQKTAEQRRQIQNELADVGRRIATWEDAFERGVLPAESGADKVLVLKAKRTELVQTLGKIVPLKPPPAHLYSDASIERFRSSIRDIFLGGSHAIARNDLRFLVERIVITDNKIELVAKAGAALQAMAGGQKNTEVSAGEPVLTSVVDWLLEGRISRTWKFAKDPDSSADLRAVENRPLRRQRAADLYLAVLAANPGISRAELARRCGVSRAAVTQALRGHRD